jgi:hypothetical protein
MPWIRTIISDESGELMKPPRSVGDGHHVEDSGLTALPSAVAWLEVSPGSLDRLAHVKVEIFYCPV